MDWPKGYSLQPFLFSLPHKISRPREGRITIGLTTRIGTTGLPFIIAEEKGIFKAEGLDAVIVIMQNQVVVNGVVGRQVDYGGTFSNMVGAALAGLPVRIVMSVMEGSDHYLVTAPHIKESRRSQGQEIRHQQFRRDAPQRSDHDLKKVRSDPEKDVTFLQIGGSSRALHGLGQRFHRRGHAGAAFQ